MPPNVTSNHEAYCCHLQYIASSVNCNHCASSATVLWSKLNHLLYQHALRLFFKVHPRLALGPWCMGEPKGPFATQEDTRHYKGHVVGQGPGRHFALRPRSLKLCLSVFIIGYVRSITSSITGALPLECWRVWTEKYLKTIINQLYEMPPMSSACYKSVNTRSHVGVLYPVQSAEYRHYGWLGGDVTLLFSI